MEAECLAAGIIHRVPAFLPISSLLTRCSSNLMSNPPPPPKALFEVILNDRAI